MDNKTRNIHRSGALGELLKRGQVSEVNEDIAKKQQAQKNNALSYALKDTNVKFSPDELVYVDPKACEPWEFANRGTLEMGDIQGLMDSISSSGQTVPVLIRDHENPHDSIRYEVIFGRRRYEACLRLDMPLMAIKKKKMGLTEALMSQHSENKCRDDVSPYSDALLYKKLLDEKYFDNQTALSKAIDVSKQTISDILKFTKLPQSLIDRIPNPHKISIKMCVSMCSLIDQEEGNLEILLQNAPNLGITINSVKDIENLFKRHTLDVNAGVITKPKSTQILSNTGQKLFTYKESKAGVPTITLNQDILKNLEKDELCKYLKDYFEENVI